MSHQYTTVVPFSASGEKKESNNSYFKWILLAIAVIAGVSIFLLVGNKEDASPSCNCTASATIRAPHSCGGPNSYKATTDVLVGADIACPSSKCCQWSASPLHINLERIEEIVANCTTSPKSGTVEYWNGHRNSTGHGNMHHTAGNWVDPYLYTLHINEYEQETLVCSYHPDITQCHNETGIQWKIEGWGHTVLHGIMDKTSVPGKTRLVIQEGFQPFDVQHFVNPQESFVNVSYIPTELIAYSFDGSLDDLTCGSTVLTAELKTDLYK
jgi:hypothetical protein